MTGSNVHLAFDIPRGDGRSADHAAASRSRSRPDSDWWRKESALDEAVTDFQAKAVVVIGGTRDPPRPVEETAAVRKQTARGVQMPLAGATLLNRPIHQGDVHGGKRILR